MQLDEKLSFKTEARHWTNYINKFAQSDWTVFWPLANQSVHGSWNFLTCVKKNIRTSLYAPMNNTFLFLTIFQN